MTAEPRHVQIARERAREEVRRNGPLKIAPPEEYPPEQQGEACEVPLPSPKETGEQHRRDPKSQPPPPGYALSVVDSATFARANYALSWAVRRLLVRDQPAVVGGPRKALKTSLLVDMALSLGSGTPFLGEFAVEKALCTCVLSGESGEHTIQETARRVADAKGIDLASANVLWGFRLPQLGSPLHLEGLRKGLEEHRAEVLLFDPLYLALLCGFSGRDRAEASNLFSMGPLLLGVAQACLSVGCTPILVHHAGKPSSAKREPLELEDLAYAGIGEFARQWLLISRREPYQPGTGEHRLWLSAGGSAGHGGLWSVDISEGVIGDSFTGRKWEVSVRTGTDARRETTDEKKLAKRRKEEEQNQEDDRELMAALDRLDPAGAGASWNKVQAEARLSDARMQRAVTRLMGQKTVEEVKDLLVTIGNGAQRKVLGLRRSPE